MADDSPSGVQTQWEYRTVTRKTEQYLVDDLNEAGKEGWELVSILRHHEETGMGEAMNWTAFIKRPATGLKTSVRSHQELQAAETERRQRLASMPVEAKEEEFEFEIEEAPGAMTSAPPPVPPPVPIKAEVVKAEVVEAEVVKADVVEAKTVDAEVVEAEAATVVDNEVKIFGEEVKILDDDDGLELVDDDDAKSS